MEQEIAGMMLMALALCQTVPEPQAVVETPPPPVSRLVAAADGSKALAVDRAAAVDRDALEERLAAEAAQLCGASALDLGEFSYNQAVDGDGNPAAEMTQINQAFRCVGAELVAAPAPVGASTPK